MQSNIGSNDNAGSLLKRESKLITPLVDGRNTYVKVSAPGTVANLVCGFDILGLCLNEPNDIMEVQLLDEKKIIIHSADGYPLPLDPAQNTAGAPLIEMINELEGNIGFEKTLPNK